ncbi:uncharacterized protein RCH25_040315 [Pelodytes ibericus]
MSYPVAVYPARSMHAGRNTAEGSSSIQFQCCFHFPLNFIPTNSREKPLLSIHEERLLGGGRVFENGNANENAKVIVYRNVKENMNRKLPMDSSVKSRTHSSFSEEVIYKVPGSLRIHPSLWTKEDVIHWLRWSEEEYSLQRTDDSKFIMNGRGLCVLTKDDFKNRSPSSGDVLYELLTCIKTHRNALIKYPFNRQSLRELDHQPSHVCINTTTARSHTTHKDTTQLQIIDKKHYQEGPLNLSKMTHRKQEEEALYHVQNGDHRECKKTDAPAPATFIREPLALQGLNVASEFHC